MIIRTPNNYYFSIAPLQRNNFQNYMRNDSINEMKNEKDEDVYSFKFADDEYVDEITMLHK